MSKSEALKPGTVNNFQTIQRASEDGCLALVSMIRKTDQKSVAVICAMQQNDDETITPIPFAVMIEDENPFELFEDPTA